MKKILALLLTLALTDCALASHGTRQSIEVSSDPIGARAAMICDGRMEGESLTPGAITIKRRHDVCGLTFTKEGFEPVKVKLMSAASRSFGDDFADVAAYGGLTQTAASGDVLGTAVQAPLAAGVAGVSVLVDKLSGAYYEWMPHAVSVHLQPKLVPTPEH
jgi:hypothetical protein